MSHALGYVIDHPAAIASNESDKHWPMALLMAAVPFRVPPPRWVSPDIRPAALDQDGLGACVAFAACTIADAQNHIDWGTHKYASGTFGTPTSGSPTGAYLTYRYLKLGTPDGSFPGDGIPTVEGSWPEAVWKMARVYGTLDAQNRPHKITAYYAHNLGNDADLAFLQGVLMEYGPVNLAIPWAGNWMTAPAGPNYIMPRPGGMVGGHSFTVVGWETYAGIVHLTCMNSWGTWGNAQGLFRFPASWLYASPLGPQLIWKTVDAPDAPSPPPPDPEGPMLTLTDKTARTVDSTVGVQLWRADGTTPLVKLSSGVTGIASPAKYADAAGGVFYSLVITSGGIPQLAWIKAADAFNVKIVGTDPAAIEAARKAGEAFGAKEVKEAAIAEAILHGG